MSFITRLRRDTITKGVRSGNRLAIVVAILGWLWRRSRGQGMKADYHQFDVKPGETITIAATPRPAKQKRGGS